MQHFDSATEYLKFFVFILVPALCKNISLCLVIDDLTVEIIKSMIIFLTATAHPGCSLGGGGGWG